MLGSLWACSAPPSWAISKLHSVMPSQPRLDTPSTLADTAWSVLHGCLVWVGKTPSASMYRPEKHWPLAMLHSCSLRSLRPLLANETARYYSRMGSIRDVSIGLSSYRIPRGTWSGQAWNWLARPLQLHHKFGVAHKAIRSYYRKSNHPMPLQSCLELHRASPYRCDLQKSCSTHAAPTLTAGIGRRASCMAPSSSSLVCHVAAFPHRAVAALL
ncbi:hypothetical protein B0H63DRAFT_163137 [Podospora didyma]|uniref:Uncharacterized protein n=1 Tax=Podospora didyma TaxID=330526 RepID=A0AAE0NU15_9PEZI|nr:hypothetical protein B0H63DRAFT_163137 [Podospora didyma]